MNGIALLVMMLGVGENWARNKKVNNQKKTCTGGGEISPGDNFAGDNFATLAIPKAPSKHVFVIAPGPAQETQCLQLW